MMRRHTSWRQRGVAVVTALLLTTLAVTIVTSLFWQQQVQVRSMENQRLHLQTKWILRGALDWARLILRSDNSNVTTLDGVWTTPLAETRLDQYIERERAEGERFDATLSGRMIDAQSRYNLTNLTSGKKINDGQVTAFGRLLRNLRLDPGLAPVTALAFSRSHLARDKDAPATPGDAGPAPQQGATEPMKFVQLEDLLSLPGFTPQAVERLREFVVVLPVPDTSLNVNTAPAEVLAAVIDFSVAEASALVASRKQAYFLDIPKFLLRLNGKNLIDGVKLDVKSNYFLVSSRIRLDRAVLDTQALIERGLGDSNQVTTTLLSIREN
jgi:general secretion pathway protein K